MGQGVKVKTVHTKKFAWSSEFQIQKMVKTLRGTNPS